MLVLCDRLIIFFIIPVNTCIRAIVLNLSVVNKGNYVYLLSLDQLFLPLYESHINLYAEMKMAGLILWPFLLNINLLLTKSCEERGKHSNFKSRIFWFVLFLIIVYECVHVLLAMYINATHKCMYKHVLVLTEHSNLNFFWEFLFPFNMNIHKSVNFFWWTNCHNECTYICTME